MEAIFTLMAFWDDSVLEKRQSETNDIQGAEATLHMIRIKYLIPDQTWKPFSSQFSQNCCLDLLATLLIKAREWKDKYPGTWIKSKLC